MPRERWAVALAGLDFLLPTVVHPFKAQTENIDRANHDVMVRFGAAACGTGGVIFFVRVWANDPGPTAPRSLAPRPSQGPSRHFPGARRGTTRATKGPALRVAHGWADASAQRGAAGLVVARPMLTFNVRLRTFPLVCATPT